MFFERGPKIIASGRSQHSEYESNLLRTRLVLLLLPLLLVLVLVHRQVCDWVVVLMLLPTNVLWS